MFYIFYNIFLYHRIRERKESRREDSSFPTCYAPRAPHNGIFPLHRAAHKSKTVLTSPAPLLFSIPAVCAKFTSVNPYRLYHIVQPVVTQRSKVQLFPNPLYHLLIFIRLRVGICFQTGKTPFSFQIWRVIKSISDVEREKFKYLQP